MDIANPSIAAVLALSLYALIDKVIVPLIKKKNGSSHGVPSSLDHSVEVQGIKNEEYERRISANEAAVSKAVEVNTAIQSDLREALTLMTWIQNDWRSRNDS